MGEIAEMMLDGTLCEGCGVFTGDACGYVRRCGGCRKDAPRAPKAAPPKAKVACPECGKRVKAVGLADHQRDAHGTPDTMPSLEDLLSQKTGIGGGFGEPLMYEDDYHDAR